MAQTRLITGNALEFARVPRLKIEKLGDILKSCTGNHIGHDRE